MFFERAQLWHRIVRGIGLIASFAFSLYVLYSWQGRIGLLAYVAVFFLAHIFARYGLGYKALARGIIVVVLVIASVYPLSIWLTPGKTSDSMQCQLAAELSFPIASMLNVPERGEFRYGRDILQAPAYILPSRIWAEYLGFDTASNVNTENIWGRRKGETGQTGEVPVDFVTFGYMQLGILGIVAIGILWGVILKALDRGLYQAAPSRLCAMFYSCTSMIIVAETSLYADPSHIVIRNFNFIVGYLLLAYVCWRSEMRASWRKQVLW